ncbi:ArsR/SmtB family transcription factor [Cochlodiniinecator piscidefendens]|uniref:ArsR/SmtB family transcription factor n=1 Tax=Cochlodiniinecator piscidefendens TaxID=2715756 RepID=UPI00140BB290|nr:metalloregulator ArsR/SmtB family transcription factor [Cochlodiniinecator piscidefendens]
MTDHAQRSFRALADPTRRDILRLLSQHEMTIAEVAENFQMTRAAVKKHLSILQDGELISMRAIGRTKVNALNPDGMKRINDWLSYFDTFWDDKLADLKTSIEKDMQ